jgi:hypothetical protein
MYYPPYPIRGIYRIEQARANQNWNQEGERVQYVIGMYSLLYKFWEKCLTLNTYHPAILSLREEGCEEPWLVLKAKGAQEQTRLGNTDLDTFVCWQSGHNC